MKKALIIYSALESSINDSIDMEFFLVSRNYNVRIIPDHKAKRRKVLKMLFWLSDSTESFLYFSGHGKSGSLLCNNDKIDPRDIDKYLLSRLRGSLCILIDCCGDVKLPHYDNVSIINNISNMAYDRIIQGKRRGLLTHSFLNIMKNYNYSISVENLEIELSARLSKYKQKIKVKSIDRWITI